MSDHSLPVLRSAVRSSVSIQAPLPKDNAEADPGDEFIVGDRTEIDIFAKDELGGKAAEPHG
jgi:hypothetical protein